MFTAIKIRLYPTKQQARELTLQFGCARWVYNNALEECQKRYKETGKGLSFYDMAARLPKLKQELPWLKEAYAQCLQASVQNLARAFENFFAKRARYPKFKSKHSKQAIQFPQGVDFRQGKIRLPKIGLIKCVISTPITGKMKTVTISRNNCNQFYASVLIEDGKEFPSISAEGKVIGIDIGLIHLAVTSDNSKFENPRHLRKAEKNLKRKQQKFSRKKKGLKQRQRARLVLARAYQRISDSRNDFLHKLSRRLVNENQVIVVENLNVKGMMKNHKLARAIGDVGWSTLLCFLEYKCQREGKVFLKIDRWFPSSRICSCCFHQIKELPLNVRSWKCEKCNTLHDRDINAAKNIRDEGLRMLAAGTAVTASGGNVRLNNIRKSVVSAVAVET